MTELVIVKLAIGEAGATIGLFGTLAVLDPSVTNIVSVAIGGAVTITMGIIAYRTNALNKRIDAQTEKINRTLAKTEVIEGHVNSEKTRDAGAIAALQKEVAVLREVMADKKESASLLAQSVATHPVPSTPPPSSQQ